MDLLDVQLDEAGEGVWTLEAQASTPAAQHPAVMAQVQQVLDWAWGRFPHSHGPVDEGMDWHHDLQLTVEDGDWHTVALTLTGNAAFIDAFIEAFRAHFKRPAD